MANLVANELECLTEAWAALDEFVQGLSPEQLTALGRDRWTIKDHLAHIAVAEQFTAAALTGQPVHEVLRTDPATVVSASDDEINEIVYRLNRSLTETEVLELRERAHRELMEVFALLSDGDLLKPFAPYGEPLGMSVLELLRKNTSDHYELHRGWLEEIAAPAQEVQ